MRAVKRRAAGKDSPHELDVIAAKCVAMALDGDLAAMKEIGNRLDGKPVATVVGDSDKPHELVIRVVDPTKPASC